MIKPASILLAVASLTACDRAVSTATPAKMSGEQLSTEMQRCKALGLQAYDDRSCKAAQQESNDRFLGKSKEPAS